MYRGTPYMNKVLKKRQEQTQLINHMQRIKQIRPSTTNQDYRGKKQINNNKRYMIQEDRFTQIERQNRLLLEKIATNMNKKGNWRKRQKERMNKSLNSGWRRKQMEQIEVENVRMLRRLQQKKSAYDSTKLTQQWKKQQEHAKHLANFQVKNRSRVASRSIKTRSSIHHDHSMNHNVELMRAKNIDGVNMIVTVTLDAQKLIVKGDCKGASNLKIIEIRRDEALQFIEQECEGRIQHIFNRLKYDVDEDVLYLLSKEMQDNEMNQGVENGQEEYQLDRKKIMDEVKQTL